MKKLFFSLKLVLFLVTTSCGYQPIYSNVNSNFNIRNVEIKNNNDLNYKIKNSLKVFSRSKSNIEYDLEIDGNKTVSIISKDAKGNAKIYRMTVKLRTKIFRDNKNIDEISSEENFNYNNKTNKFNLKQYEKDIESNLIEKNIENIIFYITNLE